MQGPICWVKPWQWLFTRYSSLRYDKVLHGGTPELFRGFAERIDMEMAGNSYAILTSAISDSATLIILFATAPILVSQYSILFACYGAAFLLALAFVVVGKPSKKYADFHEREWVAHRNFLARRDAFFDEAVAHRVYHCGEDEVEKVMQVRRNRTLMRDAQWYMRQNRQDYIGWAMQLPAVMVFLLSPTLADFGFISVGAISALLSQMPTASTKLASLVTQLLNLHGAFGCVKAFADILNLELATGAQLAANSRATEDARAAECVSPGEMVHLGTVIMRGVRLASSELDGIFEEGFCVPVEGQVPLGRFYGVADDVSPEYTLRHRLLLGILAGLLSPADGAIVVPPSARAVAPTSLLQYGTVAPSRTLLETLRYGVDRMRKRPDVADHTGCMASVRPSAVWAV